MVTSSGISILKRLCQAPEIIWGENSKSRLKCRQLLSRKDFTSESYFTPDASSSAFCMGLIFHNSTMHKALPAFLPTEFVLPQQITTSPRKLKDRWRVSIVFSPCFIQSA